MRDHAGQAPRLRLVVADGREAFHRERFPLATSGARLRRRPSQIGSPRDLRCTEPRPKSKYASTSRSVAGGYIAAMGRGRPRCSGARGSRARRERRGRRRRHGPIGLASEGGTGEIALAILAEITAVRYGRRNGGRTEDASLSTTARRQDGRREVHEPGRRPATHSFEAPEDTRWRGVAFAAIMISLGGTWLRKAVARNTRVQAALKVAHWTTRAGYDRSRPFGAIVADQELLGGVSGFADLGRGIRQQLRRSTALLDLQLLHASRAQLRDQGSSARRSGGQHSAGSTSSGPIPTRPEIRSKAAHACLRSPREQTMGIGALIGSSSPRGDRQRSE